ncbi:MAG: single-stranded DNA-binding protein, partial [Pseudomonadota bacterium]
NYIAPFAKKGSRVVLQGHVENDTWTGRDGLTHFDLRLVVRDMRIKTRRDEVKERVREPEPEPQFDLDDEIPF